MILDARLVPPERVRVVPHGGPTELLPGAGGDGRSTRPPHRAIGTDRAVLSTFGLISPGKGIEIGDRGDAGDRRAPPARRST